MPRPARSAALPTPGSWSSCGVLIAPPQTMTSPARTCCACPAPRVYSTPTARVIDAPAVQARLGLGFVLPVVEPAADGEGERRRHVDEHVPAVVGPARLQYQHPGGWFSGQPVRQGAAGRAAAHNHVVIARICHRALPR